MTTKIPVFYDERMVALGGRRFSPSAEKPIHVVRKWQEAGHPIEVVPFEPASRRELARAHDPTYVAGVLLGKRANGFGDMDPRVASSLPFTSGSMLAAARHVLEQKAPVAVSPTSGFHHAGYDSGGGFCTFNGLMVTACALLEAGHKRVGILDCDMHYGDGTDDIIRSRGLAERVRHFTAGEHYMRPRDAAAFFDTLPTVVEGMRDCAVVLYQAGADPHVNDPLGGWLTTDELRARDEIVFAVCQRIGVPVVWNLAGGYQKEKDGSIPKVLEIHDNTMRACVRTFLGA